MAELAERARRVRESIMDRTRSDGVVPTTAQLCQDLGLSRADLAEDLKNLEAAFSVARQDAAHAELKQFQGEVLDEPLPPLSEIMYARPFAAPKNHYPVWVDGEQKWYAAVGYARQGALTYGPALTGVQSPRRTGPHSLAPNVLYEFGDVTHGPEPGRRLQLARRPARGHIVY